MKLSAIFQGKRLALLMVLLLAAGCTPNTSEPDKSRSGGEPAKTSTDSAADNADNTKPDSKSAKKTDKESNPAQGSKESKTVEAGQAEDGTKDDARNIIAQATSGKPDKAGTAGGNGQTSVNMLSLPDDLPICTVGGDSIKVADYKRMLLIQQIQANQAIMVDPVARAKLLEQAIQLGVSLNPEEKARLIQAAHRQRGKDEKDFQNFLKSAHVSEKQFDDEIVQTGLAFKTSNAIIEQSLLSDLVNRALLAQAARKSGGEKEAVKRYEEFKGSKNYDAIAKQTGFKPEALKQEMVQAELAKVEIGKLESQSKVSDAELKKLYDKLRQTNKGEQLKHGTRIRLSTILIACPENDVGPVAGLRNQVKKANPKLSDKEVDEMAAKIMEQQQRKALACLQQAKSGVDFAKLANDNSNDPTTQVKKNGGDLGFVEEKDMPPALAKPLFKLKANEVLPQIVKSELGYNIYKVTGREGPGLAKYAEIKPKLEIIAGQAKMQEVLTKWLEHQRKVVHVEFTPKFLAVAGGGVKAN